MKASIGAISSEGAMSVCTASGGHGAMSRTPRDLSDIVGILMGGGDFLIFSVRVLERIEDRLCGSGYATTIVVRQSTCRVQKADCQA